jgi:hypothetical protein
LLDGRDVSNFLSQSIDITMKRQAVMKEVIDGQQTQTNLHPTRGRGKSI